MLAASAPTIARRVSIVRHLVVSVETRRACEFVDITAAVSAALQGLGILDGIVIVQTRHTTTGILVNEHEPLLLGDLEEAFERFAPASAAYAHDDLTRRTVTIGPGERRNGYAHCRAALLRASETLPIARGALTLGRWQRVFLVEFDGGQRRQVSLTFMGEARSAEPESTPPFRFP